MIIIEIIIILIYVIYLCCNKCLFSLATRRSYDSVAKKSDFRRTSERDAKTNSETHESVTAVGRAHARVHTMECEIFVQN